MEKIAHNISLPAFERKLISLGVPIKDWTSGTKDIADLHKEVRSGISEIILYESAEGEVSPERNVPSVVIDVCRTVRNGLEKLYEKTRFIKGVEKPPRTAHSLSGKIRPNERRREAATRCLEEKLGFGPFIFAESLADRSPLESAMLLLKSGEASKSYILTRVHMYESDDHTSFPGLPTLRELHLYLCLVPEATHRRKTHVRTYGSKRTLYEWIKLEPNKSAYLWTPPGS
jgi:hypothetical protein